MKKSAEILEEINRLRQKSNENDACLYNIDLKAALSIIDELMIPVVIGLEK